jgi:hypothetical protein
MLLFRKDIANESIVQKTVLLIQEIVERRSNAGPPTALDEASSNGLIICWSLPAY